MAKNTYLGANVVTTDSFAGWIDKTNQVRDDMGRIVVTVTTASGAEPNTTNAGLTTGNLAIQGVVTANTIAVSSALRGGTVTTPGNLSISSNVLFTTTGNVEFTAANNINIDANNLIISSNVNFDGGATKLIRIDTANTTVNTGTFYVNSNAIFGSNVTITGIPTAPTALSGTSTTQIATTAFVTTAVSTGSTNKANISGDTFTGLVVFDAGLKTNNSDVFYLGTSNNASIQHTGSHLFIVNGTGNIYQDLSSNGQVIIRDSTSTTRFTFDTPTGNFTASGDITSNSDARLKENITTINNALDKVTSMRGVYFNKIGYIERKIGLIAQEVEAVIPEAVNEDANGIKSVAYANLIGLLIEALKDVKNEIDTIKADINNIRSKE